MDYISPRDDPESQADKLGNFYMGWERASAPKPEDPDRPTSKGTRVRKRRPRGKSSGLYEPDGHRVTQDLDAADFQANTELTPEQERVHREGVAMARRALALAKARRAAGLVNGSQ